MNGPEKGPNYGESRTKTPKLGNTDGENGSTYYGINSLDENMDSDTFTFCSRNFRQKLSWMQIQLCALKKPDHFSSEKSDAFILVVTKSFCTPFLYYGRGCYCPLRLRCNLFEDAVITCYSISSHRVIPRKSGLCWVPESEAFYRNFPGKISLLWPSFLCLASFWPSKTCNICR